MKLIFEASNTVEAHMILNLLKQAGLNGRIDGEYLQGGVGDLPAMGLVRVMIDDSDYDEAQIIITEWNSNQPVEVKNKPIKKSNYFSTGIFGFILGSIFIAIFYNTPVTYEGIDYNNDGKLDEKWTYIDDRISASEADRNFDGVIDYVQKYNRKSLIVFAKADDNFDGEFETKYYYNRGNIVNSKKDTTGDGFYNYLVSYTDGVVVEIVFLNKETKAPIKIQKFNSLKLISAKIDTNGDGILDASYEYNEIEEIIK